MASSSKISFLFIFSILFIFLPHCLLSLPIPEGEPLLKDSPLFGFMKGLQGCKKGDKMKGISQLKKYLQYYGYFSRCNIQNNTLFDNDAFDDLLESAIKTYQLYFHLNPTGTLNAETISQLATPRCGVADIFNDTSQMLSEEDGGTEHDHHGHIHAVSHYSFFPGRPKWPPSKYRLTYAFLPGTRADAKAPVARAFRTWAANTHFTFTLVANYRRADIKIGFYKGNHGDGFPFDGVGGTLAHAFAPTDGRFHYDAVEKWAVGAVRGRYDMQTVALHEIGHLLGLRHSTVQNAIMYPYIRAGATKGLNADDIRGIKALYNRR